MSTLSERAALAADPTFIARTRQAAMRFVLYNSPNPSWPENDVRMAKSFLGAPDHWAAQFAVALAQEENALSGGTNDPAADTEAGDTELSYGLEVRVWPAFAREV